MNHRHLFHPFFSRYSVGLWSEVRLSFSASSSQSWWQVVLVSPWRWHHFRSWIRNYTQALSAPGALPAAKYILAFIHLQRAHPSVLTLKMKTCLILLLFAIFYWESAHSQNLHRYLDSKINSHSPWYNFSIDSSEEDPIALPLAMASVFDHIPKFKCPQGQVKIRGKCFKLTSS